jgi:predicted O-methyltransferase YrrM
MQEINISINNSKTYSMNKIRKSLRAMGMILRKPYLLNLILDENDNWKQYVLGKYPKSSGLPGISLTELFGPLQETVDPFMFLDGGSLPTDLALLRCLARQVESCSYFEIGTWRGESVANVSPLAAECYTMDLPDDEKQLAGMTEDYLRQHAMLSKHLQNVIHLKANSLHYDFASLGKKFDLIFIDGDHHYKGVLNDTRKAVAHLAHENSVLVWHDYAFNPERVRYEVFSGILDGLPAGWHDRLYHVDNTICAVYFPKGAKITGSVPPAFKVTLTSK